MNEDPIAKVLDDLLNLDDILACMVARQNMISVMPSDDTDSFKPEVNEVWDISGDSYTWDKLNPCFRLSVIGALISNPYKARDADDVVWTRYPLSGSSFCLTA